MNHLFLFILSCFILSRAQSQDLFDKEHRTKYACYTYSVGDYAAAAHEYAALYQDSSATDSVCYLFLRSCIRSKNYRLATQVISAVDLQSKKAFIRLEYYKLLLLDKKYTLADSLITKDSMLQEQDQRTLLIYSALLANKQKKAKQLIADCSVNNIPIPASAVLSKIRPAWHYGLASALIPGMGKILYGRPADGLMAGGITLLNAAVSYRAFLFRGYSNANVWIFGALAIGFYLGNIYGTVKLVRTTPVFIVEIIKQNLENESSLTR